MERDRVLLTETHPGAARAVFPAKFLWSRRHGAAPPCSGAQGSPRPAARAAARTASGCRPASPARPSALGRTSTRQRGARGAGTVLGEEACPEARRASWGTAAAPGAPTLPWATTRTRRSGASADGGSRACRPPRSREGGFLGAVRRIGLPAPAADARIRRRVVLFGASSSPGRWVRPWPGAPRCWPRLCSEPGLSLLALAAVERPRHRPGRTKRWTSSVSIRFRDVFARQAAA